MKIIVLLLMALVVPVFAASSSSYSRYSAYSNSVNLDFSGGLATVGGGYGGTFLVGVDLPVERSSPVRLGFDSGILFGRGVALPILVSVLYQFGRLSSGVHPYVGGAVGPVIGLSGANVDIGGYSVPTSWVGSGVKLAILVRPGLGFRATENLDIDVEMALGGLTGIFYIAPTLGLQLRV